MINGHKVVPHINKRRFLLLVIASLVVIAVMATAWATRERSPFPETVKKANIIVLAPVDNESYSIDKQSVSFNTKEKVLFFDMRTPFGKISMAEQNTPDAFNDSPQVYPQLLSKMNEYKELNTSIGKVTLTSPEELNGTQTAVAHVKGTLLFARPASNISDVQWQLFFDSFEVVN